MAAKTTGKASAYRGEERIVQPSYQRDAKGDEAMMCPDCNIRMFTTRVGEDEWEAECDECGKLIN
jgi:hypothetical protein